MLIIKRQKCQLISNRFRKKFLQKNFPLLPFICLRVLLQKQQPKKALGGNLEVNDLLGYLNMDREQVVESKGKAVKLLFQSLKQLSEAQFVRNNERLVLPGI